MHREGNGTPLQYSCLENPMNGEAWKAAVHGVSEGRTRPSDFTFTFHFHALEKEMATHSSVLAWRIPGTAEPGGLPFMGSHRVGHDWSDLAAAAAAEFAKFLKTFIFKNNSYMTFKGIEEYFTAPILNASWDFIFFILFGMCLEQKDYDEPTSNGNILYRILALFNGRII